MKRSAELVRKVSLRAVKPLGRTRAPHMTAKRKAKARPGRDKAMLQACRGEQCYLAIPGVCQGDTATVVPCHANWAAYGKGMGLKAEDRYTVPGCRHCHYQLDQGTLLNKEEKRLIWEAAFRIWAPARGKKLDAKSAAVTADAKTAASTGVQSLGSRLINQ